MHNKSSMISALVGLSFACAWAAPKFSFNEAKSTLEITQTYQFWAVGMPDPQIVPPPDKRLDFYIRRARFGFKGQAFPRLDYQTQFAFDNLGKDPFTGTIGSPQKLENTEFRTWDAYCIYHLDSAYANITFGLFRPEVSREFVNLYSGVPSLEYALSYYYLRDHLDTRPTARETGINLGGLYADSTRIWGISYNFGVFDKVKGQFVLADNIAQVAEYIVTQSADIGLTAMAIAMSEPMRGKGTWVAVDTSLYSPIGQAAIILKYDVGMHSSAGRGST
jgi:hypothetical protein